MKLAIFEKNKSEVKWKVFFDIIKINLEKGNAVFIGNKKQVKKLKEGILANEKL